MQTLLDPIIGLRIDGRKPHELRKIHCEVGVFAQADGSATLSQGNTKIIATVYGPHEVNYKLILIKIKIFIKVLSKRIEQAVRRAFMIKQSLIVSIV